MISKRDRWRLRSLLQKEKKQIEQQLKKLGAVDFGADADLDEDEANEVEQRWDNQAAAGVLAERLAGINAALQKMKEGTYGVCENCRGEIGMDLLQINPASQLCQKCKREHGQDAR